MKIIETLKTKNVRLSYGCHWMFWENNEWIVLEREPYQKKNRTKYRGDDEETAIKELLAA